MPERDRLMRAIEAQKKIIQRAKKGGEEARKAREREERERRLRPSR